MEEEFWLPMNDATPVYVKRWFDANRRPKAIIQLAHGMAEHINRYDEFASFLVQNGFDVYGNDHRGHGKTGEKQGLMGFLAEQDGFFKTTNDLYTITRHIIEHTYQNTPIILFGHSMGSFLTRHYIQLYSEKISGVILSGTGYTPHPLVPAAKTFAGLLPKKEQSPIMNNLIFGGFNKHVTGKGTSFDWLSRDKRAVETYIADTYCGFVPTGGFFHDLMTGLEYIQSHKMNKQIRSDIPVLIMSGDADPVGPYEKGIWKTAGLLEKAGVQEMKIQLYSGARHELLHETNKKNVFHDVLRWINENIIHSSGEHE